MVIRDLAFADHHVMGKYATNRLVEPAANRFLGNLEVSPGGGAAGIQLSECLFYEVEGSRSSVCLEGSERPIPLERVAPLRNLPLEGGFRQQGRLGKIDLYAMAGSLYIADVDQ